MCFGVLTSETKSNQKSEEKEEEDEKKISKKQKFFLSFVSNSRSQLSRHTFIRERFSFEKKKKKLKKKKEKTKNAEEPQNHNLFSNHARTRNKSDRRVKDEEWRRLLHLINIYAWEKIYKKNINL